MAKVAQSHRNGPSQIVASQFQLCQIVQQGHFYRNGAAKAVGNNLELPQFAQVSNCRWQCARQPAVTQVERNHVATRVALNPCKVTIVCETLKPIVGPHRCVRIHLRCQIKARKRIQLLLTNQ